MMSECRWDKMYIARSLRDEPGCVEAKEGAVMVRVCDPTFGDADALELTLTTGYRSVNAKEMCKCGKVAVCNAANHCLLEREPHASLTARGGRRSRGSQDIT